MKRFLFSFLLLSWGVKSFAYDNTQDELIRRVILSLANAEMMRSKLDKTALGVSGLTGLKIRHFLNNLCSYPGTSYLEIGCWKGSTLISAIYKNAGNLKQVVAIDNWSQFDGPKSEFFSNIRSFAPEAPLKFIDQDCFSVTKSNVFSLPINVYFFDGAHDAESQEKAFTYFNDIFEGVFIAMVDDWNWDSVREGTKSAFKKLGYTILFETTFDTEGNANSRSWWNGFYIAVIKK